MASGYVSCHHGPSSPPTLGAGSVTTKTEHIAGRGRRRRAEWGVKLAITEGIVCNNERFGARGTKILYGLWMMGWGVGSAYIDRPTLLELCHSQRVQTKKRLVEQLRKLLSHRDRQQHTYHRSSQPASQPILVLAWLGCTRPYTYSNGDWENTLIHSPASASAFVSVSATVSASASSYRYIRRISVYRYIGFLVGSLSSCHHSMFVIHIIYTLSA